MQGVQELWMYQEKWIRAVDLEEFNCTMRANVGLPQWLSSKECACNAGNVGDVDSIPGSGRLLGGGNGNPFHYSCLKNPMDWGACWATVRHDWKTRMRAGSQTWSPIQGGPGRVWLGAGWSSLPCAPQVPWCSTFCFPDSLVSRVSHRSWVMRGGIEQWLKLEIWSQTVWFEDQLCVPVDSLFNLSVLERLVCTLKIL